MIDGDERCSAPPACDVIWRVIDSGTGQRIGNVTARSGYAARELAERTFTRQRGEITVDISDTEPAPADELEQLRAKVTEYERAASARDWHNATVGLLAHVPEDCRTLLSETLPVLIKVMQAGTSKPAFHWRYTASAKDHKEHAFDHADSCWRIVDGIRTMAFDDRSNTPHRANQIVRLLMVLWHEMQAGKP